MDSHNVSRRQFLKFSALSTTAAALSGCASTSTAARSSGSAASSVDSASGGGTIRLGVASYSLRNFSRVQAIEMTRSLGVRYINFKSMHLPYDASPAEFAAAREQLKAAGLKLVGGGMITFEADTDAGVQKYFDYAKAAGMPTIVCTCSPATLPRIEKFAKQYDIKAAIHNHGPEDPNFPSPF
ncbi:MAG: twin-arginine translocation signal domain-containing protein, partial [Gemmatimonadaceae bacterium]